MVDRLEVSSKRPEMIGQPAEARLGGIVVYSRNEEQLRKGLEVIQAAVLKCARAYASLDRRSLLSLVAKEVGCRLDQRVFDAVVGSQLRLGRLDRVLCEAETGVSFLAVVAAERLGDFHARCESVSTWLREAKVLRVRDVRDRYFGEGWGAWSCAAHLVGRLAFVGRAEYVDRFSFTWPEGLDRACD